MSCICGGADHGPGCGVPVPSTSGYILAVTGVGAPGSKGEKGDPGLDGQSVTYAGTVMRFEDLPASAAPGDMWWVETPSPTTAFIWDDTLGLFVAAGRVQGDAGADSMVPGPAGAPGAPGKDGINGKDGAAGATGSKGDKGDTGATGATGPQGNVGAPGAQGAVGPIGPAGPAGGVGPQGEPGPAGASGSAGAAGPVGPSGPVGPQGIPGIQGPAGLGITYKSTVATVDDLPATAAQGDLYVVETPLPAHGWVWDADDSAWVDAGPVQGPQGVVGPVGPVGPAGEVGATGAAGAPGVAGAAGPMGPQGEVGPAGADSTVPGPAGPVGAQGDPGPAGPAGSDGAPGAVGPSGPAGADGAPGVAGADGAVGPAGPSAVSKDAGNSSVLGTDGLIFTPSGSGPAYTLPVATASVLGGVKVGTGLSVDGTGVLSATVATGFLPTTGGTMTGTITAPTTVPALTFGTSGYNVFGASGGVAVRSNTTNITTFTGASVTYGVQLITANTATAVRFGSAGPSLGVSAGVIQSSSVIDAAAAPTAANHLTNKAYVDAQVASAGSSVTNPVAGSSAGLTLWTGSQSAYDAVATKDPKTVYMVV